MIWYYIRYQPKKKSNSGKPPILRRDTPLQPPKRSKIDFRRFIHINASTVSIASSKSGKICLKHVFQAVSLGTRTEDREIRSVSGRRLPDNPGELVLMRMWMNISYSVKTLLYQYRNTFLPKPTPQVGLEICSLWRNKSKHYGWIKWFCFCVKAQCPRENLLVHFVPVHLREFTKLVSDARGGSLKREVLIHFSSFLSPSGKIK